MCEGISGICCGKNVAVKIACRRQSRVLSRAKIKISLKIHSWRSWMIKQIVTDRLPEILNYTEAGRGRRNRKMDFKDMI